MVDSTCLPDDVLRALVVGELTSAEAAPYEAHLTGCDACAERARNLRTSDALVALLPGVKDVSWTEADEEEARQVIARVSDRSLLMTRTAMMEGTHVSGSLDASGKKLASADPAGRAEPTRTSDGRADQAGGHSVAGGADEGTQLSGNFAGSPDATSFTLMLQPGEGTLLDAYRLEKKLGEGGMGAVWKAFHTKLKKYVALKVLPAHLLRDAGRVARFEREMEAVGRLDHPAIVRAMDAGEVHGTHYLVMEFVDGEDLKEFVKSHGPRPVAQACELVRQAAVGLAYAHGNGLVHRDIKPSNLFLMPNGKLKILDLGLARLQGEDVTVDAGEGLTGTGQVLGTPDYMAPEQWENTHTVGPACDLYALGCTLFFLLTGHPPYGDDKHATLTKKMMGHVHEPIPELPAGSIPAEVREIYRRLMAKDPARRFPSADELSTALLAFLNKTAAARKTAEDAGSAPAMTPAKPVAPLRNRTKLALGGLGAALLLGVIIITIQHRDGTKTKIEVPDTAVVSITRKSDDAGRSSVSQSAAWPGWPADAPKPAIAPFDAAQAKKHQEEWAAYLKVPVKFTNSMGMEFRLIPPGEFVMGSTPEEIEQAVKHIDPLDRHWLACAKSEGPRHTVILTQPIYLGITEVTQAQYEKMTGTRPSYFGPGGPNRQDIEKVHGLDTSSHPVEGVTWNDAAEFCGRLSQQENRKPFYLRTGETITTQDGRGYRLPTEAEWEFACRAGTISKFWIGDSDGELRKTEWFGINSGGRTQAVGERKANPFGLFDVHGNAWEWVQDWWEPAYYGQLPKDAAIDPAGPASARSARVFRGGDWRDDASSCRSSFRGAYDPAQRDSRGGFRVALVIDTVPQALKGKGPAIPKGSSEPDSTRSQPVVLGPSIAPNVPLDLTPQTKLGTWDMGPEPPSFADPPSWDYSKSPVLPGLIERPRTLPGVKRWNVDTVLSHNRINVLRVSPDGRWIAAGCGDGHVRLYDPTTLALSMVIPGRALTYGVFDLSWHPSSGGLAVMADEGHTLRLWSIAGELLFEETERDFVLAPAIVWSNDGKALAHANRAQVLLRSADGKITKVLAEGEGLGCHASQMSWSRDDARLVVWHNDGKLRSWDVNSGKAEVIDDLGNTPGPRFLARSADDWLALSMGQDVRLYGPDSKPARTLKIERDAEAIAWHPDGMRLLCSGSALTVWNRETGKEMARAVRDAWSGGGHLVAWNRDGKTCVAGEVSSLHLLGEDLAPTTKELPGSVFHLRNLTWSPDGRQLASPCGHWGPLRLWNQDGIQQKSWKEAYEKAGWVAWRPDGNQLIGGPTWFGRQFVWTTDQTGSMRTFFENEKLQFLDGSAVWTTDGQFAVMGLRGGHVQVVDRAGRLVARLATGGDRDVFVGLNPRTNRIAVAEPGQPLMFCDPARGWTLRQVGEKPLANLSTPPTWSPDGSLLAIPGNGWHDAEGEPVSPAIRPDVFAWRPDGKELVGTAEDGCFIAVYSAEGSLVRRRMMNGNSSSFGWHPRGNLLATTSGVSALSGWDATTLQPQWHALLLPAGKAATFSAAGELVDGKPEEVDPFLVYYVEREAGKIETLTPAEFRKLLPAPAGGSKTAGAWSGTSFRPRGSRLPRH